MAGTIRVERSGPGRFRVTVEDAGSQSQHIVSLKDNYYQKLARKQVSEEELIKRSFGFLLEREPKESILREFDLSVIAHYFPAYETEIQRRLGL